MLHTESMGDLYCCQLLLCLADIPFSSAAILEWNWRQVCRMNWKTGISDSMSFLEFKQENNSGKNFQNFSNPAEKVFTCFFSFALKIGGRDIDVRINTRCPTITENNFENFQNF